MNVFEGKFFSLFITFLFIFGFLFPFKSEAASPRRISSVSSKLATVPKSKNPSVYPSSRCVTSATKALHEKDVKMAEKDADVYHINEDEDLKKIYQQYREGLEISWEAMLEPYCGYGSHGLSAAQKSYVKTVTRVRATFLKQAKKIQAEEKEESED